MSTIEESIDIAVPVRTAYNQWTQFEEFPSFMEGVERVTQQDDTRLHWVADIAGVQREWDAEITEQQPDERVAWTSTTGTKNAGVVTFHRLDEDRTRVMLQLDVEPDDLVEKVGDALGFVRRRATGDLKRFKEMIESRGSESGEWRGEVPRSNP
ncbi:MAG TPA: SRPBCC family protein [Ilumatobacteraceae bacterium]|jgi:uncharacterized membrane protein